MRTTVTSVHLIASALCLSACGAGADRARIDELTPFEPVQANDPAPGGSEDAEPLPGGADDGLGESDVDPGGLDPGGLDPGGAPDGENAGQEPDSMAPSGDGLLVGGTCFAVCESDASDADEAGMTDGWGWENEASCLVEGSAAAAQGTPCPLPPELLPDIVPPGGTALRPAGVDSTGFFVSGGRLYDRLGNDFVMRGVNNPLAWFQNRNTGALAWLEQIAATGANAVRLVWETDVTDIQLLRDAVQRSIDLSLVPMVELHDVTGGRDIDDPARMARYYAETEAVRLILLDYEDYLLVNIANEWDGPSDIYVDAYTRAIDVMREAGLNHTLVIDANGYGQNAGTVIEDGQVLLAADPQRNLLFSTHMYQSFRDPDSIRAALQGAAEAQIPFIVGEFGFQHGEDNQGNPIPIPFEVLLEEAQRFGFGYLAWSWTGNSGGVEYLDLTARSGSADQLTAWGDDIVNGPNGIRATSQIASIFLD